MGRKRKPDGESRWSATPKTGSEKERVCLMCGDVFSSLCPANRRCPVCEAKLAKLSRYDLMPVRVPFAGVKKGIRDE